MIRLAFWAVIFGAGVYFGVSYHENQIRDACAELGGTLIENGLCTLPR